MCFDLDFPKCSAGSIIHNNREQREFHTEGASQAFLARDFDFAVMGSTDRFDNGEPESGSAAGAGTGFVGTIEAFEHMGQSVSRDAEAVVGDFEDRTIPLAADTDLDHATYRGVFDGVVDEVHDYLLEANPVPHYVNSSSCMDAQSDRFFFRQQLHFARS